MPSVLIGAVLGGAGVYSAPGRDGAEPRSGVLPRCDMVEDESSGAYASGLRLLGDAREGSSTGSATALQPR
jgi:hypothetical protein